MLSPSRSRCDKIAPYTSSGEFTSMTERFAGRLRPGFIAAVSPFFAARFLFDERTLFPECFAGPERSPATRCLSPVAFFWRAVVWIFRCAVLRFPADGFLAVDERFRVPAMMLSPGL